MKLNQKFKLPVDNHQFITLQVIDACVDMGDDGWTKELDIETDWQDFNAREKIKYVIEVSASSGKIVGSRGSTPAVPEPFCIKLYKWKILDENVLDLYKCLIDTINVRVE